MAGHYIPRTPLAVDFWRRKTCEAKLFFLSHMHSDHTVGLTSSWDRTIYCSEITKTLAVAKLNLNPSLLVTIPIGQSTILDIDETGVEKLTVTLIDANHCPGAVMFLFEGYFGRILYTGDFRYWDGMLDIPQLTTNSSVNDLYLDNTYCDPLCEFPSRALATSVIVDILESYHQDMYFIVIGMDSLGKEDLLYMIAVKLGVPIIVDELRYQTTKILGIESFFTTDVNDSNIRVVPKREVTQQRVTFWNKQEPTIAILPTCLYEGTFNPHASSENIFVIPYSDHSSFSEMVDFVAKVRPQRVIPIVNRPTRSDDSASRLDMSVFSEQLSSDIVPHKFDIPASVQTFMLKNYQNVNPSTSKISVRRKRKPFRYFNGKTKKACGVVFPSSKKAGNNRKTLKNAMSSSEKQLAKSSGECSGFGGASTSSVEVLPNMVECCPIVVQDERDDDKSRGQEETQAAEQGRLSGEQTKIQVKETHDPQVGLAEELKGVEEMDYQQVVLNGNQEEAIETHDARMNLGEQGNKSQVKESRNPKKTPPGETQGLRVKEMDYQQEELNGNQEETKAKETRVAQVNLSEQGTEFQVRDSRNPKKTTPGEPQGLRVEELDYQQEVLNGNQEETKAKETRVAQVNLSEQGTEFQVRDSRNPKKTPPGEPQGLRVEEMDYQQKVFNGNQKETKAGEMRDAQVNLSEQGGKSSPKKIPPGEPQGLRGKEIDYQQEELNVNQEETKVKETRDAAKESRSRKKIPPGETQGFRVEVMDYQQKVFNGNQGDTKARETCDAQVNLSEQGTESQGLCVEEMDYQQKELNGNQEGTKAKETRDAQVGEQGNESNAKESRSRKKTPPHGETQGFRVEVMDYLQKVLNGNQRDTKARETRDAQETFGEEGDESQARDSRSIKKTPPRETQGLRGEEMDCQPEVLNGIQNETAKARGTRDAQVNLGEQGSGSQTRKSRSPKETQPGETQGFRVLRVEVMDYQQKVLHRNQEKTKARRTCDAQVNLGVQGSEFQVRDSRRNPKKTPPGETQELRVEEMDYQQEVFNGNQKETKAGEMRDVHANLSEQGSKSSPKKTPPGEAKRLHLEDVSCAVELLLQITGKSGVTEKRGREANFRDNETEAIENLRKHRMEQLEESEGFHSGEMGWPREPTEKRGREDNLREKRTKIKTRKLYNRRIAQFDESDEFHAEEIDWPRELLDEKQGEFRVVENLRENRSENQERGKLRKHRTAQHGETNGFTEKRGYDGNLREKCSETQPRKSRIHRMAQPEGMDCSREVTKKRRREDNLREKSNEIQTSKSRKHTCRTAQHRETNGFRAHEMGWPREIEQGETRITEKRSRAENEGQGGKTRVKRSLVFEGTVAERRDECYSKETNGRPKAFYETPGESIIAGMKCIPETSCEHNENVKETQKSRETSSNRESETRESRSKNRYCIKKRKERSSSIYDGPCVFALHVLQKLKAKRQSK